MNEQEMIFAGVACLLLVVIGVLQALQLRATKEAEAAAVSRQAALLEALAGTGSAFTQAVDRFQQVVVTLENLALLQQIADRVDAGCTRIEDCHARLESQVETAGRVVENLHQLVGFWAEGGSRIERYYLELGKVLEETLHHDRAQREELLTWVQTMALGSKGGADDPVRSD